MHIAQNVLKTLDLKEFVSGNIARQRDKFPPIIIEDCLKASSDVVTKYIETTLSGTAHVLSEVLTMPRAGFGPRPVSITDLPSRLLYSAMVESIDSSLPESTRASGAWDAYQKFGLDGSQEYVVELDIASCYEYIDHARLNEELILRSMRLDLCSAIHDYLEELMGQSRGIPQMLRASDRLADTYLSILDRKLSRDGYRISRYVDDMRIVAANWDDANVAIEQAAEYARELGLILSSKKTYIYKTTTLIEQQEQDATFFNSRVDAARDAMTRIWFIGSYDHDPEPVEAAPEEDAAALAATWEIMMEWWNSARIKGPQVDSSSPVQRFLNRGLLALRRYEQRLPDDLLADIVFNDPRKIEQVIKYLIARAELNPEERDLRPISLLASMGRQSAWTKLWILHAVEKLAPDSFRNHGKVYTWIMEQLDDRHEIVRAQAAWLCAIHKFLTDDKLGDLYRQASSISQPALAAAGTRQADIPKRILTAISADSNLNKEASKWAESTIS